MQNVVYGSIMRKIVLVAHLIYEKQWGKLRTIIQTFVFLDNLMMMLITMTLIVTMTMTILSMITSCNPISSVELEDEGKCKYSER